MIATTEQTSARTLIKRSLEASRRHARRIKLPHRGFVGPVAGGRGHVSACACVHFPQFDSFVVQCRTRGPDAVRRSPVVGTATMYVLKRMCEETLF
jgi:hypothetical protein